MISYYLRYLWYGMYHNKEDGMCTYGTCCALSSLSLFKETESGVWGKWKTRRFSEILKRCEFKFAEMRATQERYATKNEIVPERPTMMLPR